MISELGPRRILSDRDSKGIQTKNIGYIQIILNRKIKYFKNA